MTDSQPKQWEFSGEPIYPEDNAPCWPLPPTISRDPSGPPLDTSCLDTLAPTPSHPEKNADS